MYSINFIWYFLMNRLYGLDLLRSLLIIEGVFYHASLIISPTKWTYSSNIYNSNLYGLIFQFFHLFRMENFFILSGFFSLLLIKNKGFTYFKEIRIKKLIIPFLILFIIIGIPQYIYVRNISSMDFSYANILSHLWFLETLTLISLFHFFLISKKVNINIFFILVLILIYFLSGPISGIIGKLLPAIHWSLKNFLSFSFFYFFGVFFYENKDLIFNLIKEKMMYLLAITIASTIVVLINLYNTYIIMDYNYYLSNLKFMDKYIHLYLEIPFLKILSSLGISLLLIFFFSKININNYIINLIVKAALPIYVFHHPFVVFFGYSLDNLGLDINVYFLLISILSLIISIGIYIIFKDSKPFNFIFGLRNIK